MAQAKWHRLKRTKVYASKFVNVYEDTVRLPSGTVIDDYTVVEKPDVVMVVATDTQGQLLILQEYKYAADQVLYTLPAGHKKATEDVVATAQRELLEETGFGGGVFHEPIRLYDYPTKDIHQLYVVKASGVERQKQAEHEETESIALQRLPVDVVKQQVAEGKWLGTSAIAALAVTGILS
ncbi:hypothetical protein CR970_04075 [Candidatus Saccharibacteria bacterium]|nr:MAG: hypothetical protein CR970_04075 [Candidatus Saccharibacteria bacterium]